MIKRVICFVLCIIFSCISLVYGESLKESSDFDFLGYSSESLTLEELFARRLYVYGLIENQMDQSVGIPMLFFQEYSEINRLDVVELIFKLYQYDINENTDNIEKEICHFTDVPKSHIMYVNYLYDKGIICGVSDTILNIGTCDIESFSCMILRYLGIECAYGENTNKLEELGLLKYVTLEDGFTKGDVYIIISNLLDYEIEGVKIIDKLDFVDKREEIKLPRYISFYVTSYEDFQEKLEFAYSFAPDRINLIFLKDCSIEDGYLIYDFLIRDRYSWKGLFDEFYDVSSVYSYTGLGWSPHYSEKIKDHWLVSEEPIAKEVVKRCEEIEELYNLGEYDIFGDCAEYYMEYLKSLIRFELLFTGKEIVLRLDSFNDSVYLNLDTLDWVKCYNNPEFTVKIEDYLERISIYKDLSDYEKIVKVHDFICANATYDYMEYQNVKSNKKYTNLYADAHTVEGFLIDGRIVCDGYAYTYQWLLNYLGVESIVVYGESTNNGYLEGHAWNKVKLDGKWYNVDVCWSDTGCGKTYFLKSDKFFQSHYHIFKDDFIYPYFTADENYR